ncbi:HNH endonuclease signature motif containing protein [Flexivirga caeni]|uniref:HNH endonuclease signature motif containing protein n=1 Tax=Flexivirga caeni TaxID=2294115 RepID=UPI0011CDC8B3|nr:HNH endonuclease signature motif containing protein [Flexivirga caeni]
MQDTAADGSRRVHDPAAAVENALLGDPDEHDGDATQFAAVEQANLELLAKQSATLAGRRVHRILTRIDPVAADRATTRRRRERIAVFVHPDDEPGLSHLHAILPTATAAQLMAAVDEHARQLHADTTTDKTLAECRADALTDLVLDHATITTNLVIQVPVHRETGFTSSGTSAGSGTVAESLTAPAAGGCSEWPAAFAHPITGIATTAGLREAAQPAGAGVTAVLDEEVIEREFNELLKRLYPPDPDDPELDATEFDDDTGCSPPDPLPPDRLLDAPDHTDFARLGDATIPGIGTVPACVIEAMSRSFGMTITRALIDADTGVTVETCQTRYRPGAKLAAFVRARDSHCRFPGCTRPAARCDLDHVVGWPFGPTAAWNLHCLCRHHHRTKQAHGWTVTMTPLGVCTWTSPYGRTYITTPSE